MAVDQFRVRRAGSLEPFVDIDVTAGSAQSIERAVCFALDLTPGTFVLKRVARLGPPVEHGAIVAGLHDRLSGPHEAFPASGKDL
jgi:hypothetical protein